jgi:hypothetical protein
MVAVSADQFSNNVSADTGMHRQLVAVMAAARIAIFVIDCP